MKRMHTRTRANERPACATLFDDDGPEQRLRRKGRNDHAPDPAAGNGLLPGTPEPPGAAHAPGASLPTGTHPQYGSGHVHAPADRKTLQLCAQVRRALSLALPAGDVPGTEALRIDSVQPAPDARRLLVVVSLPQHCAALAPAVRASFPQWAMSLRAEVAYSIHRKRTPVLMLHLHLRQEDEP